MITTGGIETQPAQAAPAIGATYQDPRFNNGAGAKETVRRLLDYRICNEHYARNGYWSPDNQYMIVGNSACDGTGRVINTTTGATVLQVGGGYTNDMSFDPTNSDRIYYVSGNTLRQLVVSTGVDSVFKDFGSALTSMTSVDFIDVSGRYFLVRYGTPTPTLRVWDKVDNVVYTGGPTRGGGGGWAGITPSAAYAVIAEGGNFYRYPIDHATDTIGAEALFLNEPDHGDMVSASDGNEYLVDIPGNTLPERCEKVNIVTGTRTQLFLVTAAEGHFSGVSTGPNRDWCWVSVEVPSAPGGGVDPYRNEIVAVNVVTNEVRRYAHHRSNTFVDYYAQPRVCASWDGTRIAWSSDGNGFTGSGNGMYVLELVETTINTVFSVPYRTLEVG